MQTSAAMARALSTMSRAPSSVFCSSASAALCAYGQGEHRLEPPQDAVGAPVLRQLDRRAHQVALVLLELRFEALEERERVGRAAGEAGQDAVLVDTSHLLRAALDHDLAERHLP